MNQKLIAAALAIALCSTPVSAQNLAERRAIKAYEDNQFKDLKGQIQAAAGYELPVSVDWSKLALPGEAANYSNDGFFTNIFFRPLILALKDITVDDMSKTALRAGVKEVKITYDAATAPASAYVNGVTLASGVLTINFAPWSNVDHVTERKDAIVKVLEESL